MKGEKWRFPGRANKPEPRDPDASKGPAGDFTPKYRLPVWNILLMLILLWIWQDAITNYTVKTLPYSEFKEHVRHKEVVEATVSPDRIQGKIQLKADNTNA